MLRFFSAMVVLSLVGAVGAFSLPTQFDVVNRATEPYQGVVDVVLPIPPGEVTAVSQLSSLRADGQPTVVRPIKYHRIGGVTSIAAVRLTTQMSLQANEARTVALSQGSNIPPPFQIGSGIVGLGPNILVSMLIGVRVSGGPECFTSMFGPYEVLDQNPINFTVRWRLRPVCPGGGTSPVTITSYMRLGSNNDHARFTLLVANDTLERPVAGGISAEAVLYVKDPLTVAFHQPQSFGGIPELGAVAGYRRYQLVKPTDVIADGVRLPFHFNAGVGAATSIAVRSMRAAAQNPANQVLGLVRYEDYRASRSTGLLGVLPRPRFTAAAQGQAAVAYQCQPLPNYAADDFKGTILQHPFITGDQIDFTANLPIFAQQIFQTGSTCPLLSAYVGVTAEWIRPSASSYWSMQSGQERPVTILQQLGLMLWGDGVHQPTFYNGPEFQHYISRIPVGSNPFVGGTSKFSRWDEEHDSFNSQAAVAMVVGSEELLDLMRSHLRTIYFNHYNWYRAPQAVAPRAIGRTGQSVLLLSSFFNNDIEAAVVLNGFALKLRHVLRPFVTAEQQAIGFAHAGAGPVNAGGGIYTQCLAGAFPEISAPSMASCANVYGWQTGFLIQAVAQLAVMGIETATATSLVNDFLNDVPRYFLPNGEPVTHFLRQSPTRRDLGGIGSQWWSGFAAAAELMPNHPRTADIRNGYVANILTPSVSTAPVVDTYWRNQDNWNVYEDLSQRVFRTP